MESAPPPDCPLCPRLVAFRQHWRALKPNWHNAPVPSFLGADVRLLIVGLAPGLQGANRTGRPFTGDWAGDLLYQTLLDFGFAKGSYDERADDGLSLIGCGITNAVRCVPPENKPNGGEIAACRPYLNAQIAALPNLTALLALGRIAHESTVRSLGGALSKHPFGHGARHLIGGVTLFNSYHCSRYNTNTGRLTPEMFRQVFAEIRAQLG